MKNGSMSWMKAMRMGDPYPIAYARFPGARKLQGLGRALAANPALHPDDLQERALQILAPEVSEALNRLGPVAVAKFKDPCSIAVVSALSFAEEYVHHIAGGGQVFEMSARLTEMLSASDTMNFPTELLKFPYDRFYVSLKTPIAFRRIAGQAEWRQLSGFFVRKVGDGVWQIAPIGMPGQDVSVLPEMGWLFSSPAITNRPIELNMGSGAMLGQVVEDAVRTYKDLVLAQFERMSGDYGEQFRGSWLENCCNQATAGGIEAVSKLSASGQLEDSIRTLINLVANVLCFLTAYRETGKDRWTATAPKADVDRLARMHSDKRKAKAEKELAWAGYRKVKFFRAPDEDEKGHVMTRAGVSPMSHWRRGHWRAQPWGPQNSLRRPKWIYPVIVNRDNGVIEIGHRYDVDDDGSQKAA